MQAHVFVLWVVASWVALGGAAASGARACSQLNKCLSSNGVFPADGAQGVLRNVELRLDYGAVTFNQLAKLDAKPIVEDQSGTAVAVTWTRSLGMMRGKLLAPLAAQTTYRIRHLFAVCTTGECPEYGLCPSTVATTLSTFVTGDAVDETKPAPVVFEAPEITPTIRETESSACGPYDQCTYVRKFAPLAPGHYLRLVRADHSFLEAHQPSPLEIDVYTKGSSFTPITGVLHQLDAGEYKAYVVSEMGTQSDPVPLTVPACEPYDDGEDGCSAAKSAAHSRAPWAGLLTLLVGVALRRRARSREHRSARPEY